jgi:hypothetical protein
MREASFIVIAVLPISENEDPNGVEGEEKVWQK